MKIESIQNQSFKNRVAQQMSLKQNVSFTGNVQMVSLMDSKISNSLKSIISFKGSGEAKKVDPLNWVSMDNPIIEIPDLFSLPEGEYELPSHVEGGDKTLNEQLKKLNPNGLKISVKIEDTFDGFDATKNVVITSVEDEKNPQENAKEIFSGSQKLGEKVEVPKVAYVQDNNFKPTIILTDDSLNGSAIKMFAGSKIKSLNFDYLMHGECDARKNTDLDTGVSETARKSADNFKTKYLISEVYMKNKEDYAFEGNIFVDEA